MKMENRYITGATLENPNFLLEATECDKVFRNTRGSLRASEEENSENISAPQPPLSHSLLQYASTAGMSQGMPNCVCGKSPWRFLTAMAVSSFRSPTWNMLFFKVIPTLGYINLLHGYIPKTSCSWVFYTIQGHSPELHYRQTSLSHHSVLN